ncbi:hypothetical protein AVEN_76108-1 [Araneus ventricosus]|uniref:DUF4371 domain-containing protein n=1 Tax=Araneus ventricosus TaxID=182803 RepID=A0A4Y2HBQ8_ARAVE|nr:hypothetical protein AVEN_76108-1 [Araneus ventricosus]
MSSQCSKEELLGLLPLSGQTRGEDIANAVQKCLEDNGININKNVSIATDGARTLKNMKDGFAVRCEQFKTNKSTLAFIVNPLNTNTNEINIEPFGIDAGSLQMQLLDLKTKDFWSGKFTELKSKLEELEVQKCMHIAQHKWTALKENPRVEALIFGAWNSLPECYSELKLNTKDKEALLDVCLLIVTIYVKPGLQYILAVKAPYKDLCFLKSLKAYEKVNESISKAALQKFSQHLWYFTDEIAVLVLFDDVDEETKLKMVANLHGEIFSTHEKRYIPLKEELCGSLYEKSIDDLISVKSQSLFSRLKIGDSLLNESPFLWTNNASFLDAKKMVSMLRAMNDTADYAGLSWFNNG